MSESIAKVREQQVEIETRLATMESRAQELQERIDHLAKILRGNGAEGLCSQLRAVRERVECVQGQWKWVLGLLAALGVAIAQVLLNR